MRPLLACTFLLCTMLICCAIGPRSSAQPGKGDDGLRAWYRFEDAQALGKDSSPNALTAEVRGTQAVDGHDRRGLALDGSGGLTVAGAEALHAGSGFAADLWVRFASVGQNTNVIGKDGEFFVRLDPAPEGNNLSFFVTIAGSPEPRVRGPVPEVGVWYHVVATWDGVEAVLWVNGQRFHQRRVGAVEPTDAPLSIGGTTHYGPMALQGTLDEVKLYSRPLTDQEVLVSEYGLAEGQGPRLREATFDFDRDSQGWEARDASGVTARDGKLEARLAGGTARLVQRNLDVPVKGLRYISLRMAVSDGANAEVAYLTTAGLARMPLGLIADGRMHSYIADASLDPEWGGNLRALCLAPSDAAAKVEIDFVRVAAQPDAPPEFRLEHFLPDRALNRAARPCPLTVTLRNVGGAAQQATVKLDLPPGVRPLDGAERTVDKLGYGEARELAWQVQADEPRSADLKLTASAAGATPTTASFNVPFAPAVTLPKASYVPPPQVAHSDYLVGCHYCPLWKQGSRSSGWELITPYPEREPVLGWYDEGSPEVADWEIKWCLEHGIQFFVYCWYRASQGGPVEQNLGHAIHEGLFHARYESLFKWCIMWENQNKGHAGVASEEDFLNNLLPFWIETYFKRPSYLKIDNKPLLFIYRPEYLVDDLGSVEKVKQALGKAREACKQAGFDGLYILGEYRGTDPRPLQLMVDEGLDYAFQYCWPVGGNPAPDVAIKAQESYWRSWQQQNIIPFTLTLTMGWDSTPWHPTFSAWHLPPKDFETLCEDAKAFMQTMPEGSLGRKVVLLDNWNEFGEGHYIAPHREYGFGYLDAVRNAFTDAPEQHVDLVPDDVGLGPYDSLFKKTLQFEEARSKRVTAKGGDAAGLLAWWTFDEDADSPVALDYSGHGLGGLLRDAARIDSPRGKALVCRGGSVEIPRGAFKTPSREMTIECWIKADVPDQTDKWFVNSIYGNGEGGFRLGLSQGKLCFAIPKTAWSHHMVADAPLPLGKWVHVAATYDGRTMRLYMDAALVGSLERGGRINSTDTHLCLGNYDVGHRAYFDGLLDDVRIWAKALDANDLQAQ
jgi:hypothetical protein